MYYNDFECFFEIEWKMADEEQKNSKNIRKTLDIIISCASIAEFVSSWLIDFCFWRFSLNANTSIEALNVMAFAWDIQIVFIL